MSDELFWARAIARTRGWAMKANAPLVKASERRRERNREAGRRKKGSRHLGTPSYEGMRATVADLMERGGTHNAACERTAQALGCSRSTVYRVTRDLLSPSE